MKSKNKIEIADRYEILFERTICAFLGDKAYNIAGQVHTEKYRKEWYRKALKQVIRSIHNIRNNFKAQSTIVILR